MLISTWLLPSSAYAPLIASSRTTSTRLPTNVRIDERRCSRHVFVVFATTENASGECIPVPSIILICLWHAAAAQQAVACSSSLHDARMRTQSSNDVLILCSPQAPGNLLCMQVAGINQCVRKVSTHVLMNVVHRYTAQNCDDG